MCSTQWKSGTTRFGSCQQLPLLATSQLAPGTLSSHTLTASSISTRASRCVKVSERSADTGWISVRELHA